MRGLERLRDLKRDLHSVVEGNRASLDPVGERVTLDEFHNKEEFSALLFHSIKRSDIWMIQRREHLRFTVESGEPVRILRKCIGQHLYSHAAPELCIAGLIDLTHSARADLRLDLVLPERPPD